jgi:hypothetical protein
LRNSPAAEGRGDEIGIPQHRRDARAAAVRPRELHIQSRS